LRYHNALAVVSKLICQGLAAYKGDVDERRIQFDHARELDEFCAWFIGANHYHCLRMTPPNRKQGSLNSSRTPHISAFRNKTQASLFQSPFHPFEAGTTEGIVLVQNGDLG
jgi:hypothetical protein